MTNKKIRSLSLTAITGLASLTGLTSLLGLAGPAIAAPSATSGSPILLAQHGKTSYVIALASDAIPAEKTAARELSTYLQKISGAKFPIRPESEVGAGAPQILVGSGDRVKNILPGQKWDSLGTDGIVIKMVGKDLVLTGGRPRGALYAVYSFLEDQLGVRWWTPTESTVPTRKTIRLAGLNTVYTPQLKVREPYYSHFYSDVLQDGIFAARLKANGQHQLANGEELGWHNAFAGGFVHTFGTLLPPSKYQKAHPEWFSDPENGNRPCTANSRIFGEQENQPSLTNEELRKELTTNALEVLRHTPGATMISISQNDNVNRFIGGDDQKVEAEEGSPSGPLIRFVNTVAEDIEKEFPNVMVETLAYQHTRKPPLHVRPRHNVVIRLASDYVDFSKGMAGDAGFRELIDGWKRIAPNLYIWNYTTNFRSVIFPHPNLRTLGPDIRFLAANNTIALFEQGDAYSGEGGDFTALRCWLISHQMWNPDLDQSKLEDEFLRGYYGPAAPHLKAYLSTIQEAFPRSGLQLSMYQTMHWWLDLKAMNEATRHYRRAEAAVAKNPALARRVRRERLALDHAWLLRYYPLRREVERRRASGEKVEFQGPQDIDAFAAEFLRTCREMGVEKVSESMKLADYPPILRQQMANYAAPLPDFAADRAERDVIDMQEDRFRLAGLGSIVKISDDAQASNRSAAEMVGHSPVWAVQCRLDLQYPLEQTQAYLRDSRWHCYAIVRVQAKPGAAAGPVLSAGICNSKDDSTVASLSKTLAEMGDGKYHVLDLGSHRLNPDLYFYVAPPNRDDIESVSVDRFLAVRE